MTTQLDASVKKLRRQIEVRVEQIKRELAVYIQQETHPLKEGVEVSIALLDMALDRYVDLHGEKDARDLIESAFRRAVEKSKNRLH
jgi:hypothetical protein